MRFNSVVISGALATSILTAPEAATHWLVDGVHELIIINEHGHSLVFVACTLCSEYVYLVLHLQPSRTYDLFIFLYHSFSSTYIIEMQMHYCENSQLVWGGYSWKPLDNLSVVNSPAANQ